MKRILAATAALLVLAGCDSLEAQFRNGLPQKSMVELNIPGRDTVEGKVSMTSELRGDRSNSYLLTRGATRSVNGGTFFILALIDGVTKNRPTSMDENTAVWGPYPGDALDPNTYKLTVNRTGDKNFTYALEAKGKTAPEDAWVVIVSGSHTKGETDNHGNGTFLIDWDNAQTLPEHGPEIGTAEITYAKEQGTEKVTVSAEFVGVSDGNSGTTNFSYRYSATPGAGGTFDFMVRGDINNDVGTITLEKLTIHSRWLETGAGRADIRVTEGDLGALEATGNECWDTSFNSQYANLSYDPNPASNYGTDATDCAIHGAEYSTL